MNSLFVAGKSLIPHHELIEDIPLLLVKVGIIWLQASSVLISIKCFGKTIHAHKCLSSAAPDRGAFRLQFDSLLVSGQCFVNTTKNVKCGRFSLIKSRIIWPQLQRFFIGYQGTFILLVLHSGFSIEHILLFNNNFHYLLDISGDILKCFVSVGPTAYRFTIRGQNLYFGTRCT